MASHTINSLAFQLVASLLLVVRPGAPSSFLLLVAMPGAPSSVLAPSSGLLTDTHTQVCGGHASPALG